MSTAVASLSQRNQATLPGHLIFIPVFKVFNRLAKASGFCLYFLPSLWSKASPRDRVHVDSIAVSIAALQNDRLQNDITKQVFT